jgi:hypothetical protein
VLHLVVDKLEERLDLRVGGGGGHLVDDGLEPPRYVSHEMILSLQGIDEVRQSSKAIISWTKEGPKSTT